MSFPFACSAARLSRLRLAPSFSHGILSAVLALAFTLALTAACDDAAGPSDALFVVTVSGETFRVRATDPVAIAALQARLGEGRTGVINGQLVAGDGGFNQPWNWHLDPATVDVPDLAIEVCDGRPSMVEADLTYWIGTVGRFCPWGAMVTSRVQ